MTAAAGAVFAQDGEYLVPSVHARGPWAETDMHGGGPTALLARAIEALDTPAPMQVVRLAVEFPGAVPMAPVRPRARLTRAGRRLALAEATLETEDGTVVLRAGATLLRRAIYVSGARKYQPPANNPTAAESPERMGVCFNYQLPQAETSRRTPDWHRDFSECGREPLEGLDAETEFASMGER